MQTLQFRSSTYSIAIPSSDVQHGDVYYGRAYSYTPTPVSEETNRITINAVASSTTTLPVNSSTGIFHSTLANNTACPGESFSIFTLGGSKEYTFFNASGIQLAPRSATNSHTITGITTDTQFTVQVHISSVCELTTSLDINFIGLTPGAIGTAQSVCRGETPSALQNVTAATLNKIPIAANATNYYQWESSEDGINWSVLSGVHTATFQPHALFQTTAFRRGVVDPTTSSSCRIYSNVVTVTVTPPAGGTLAAQSLCLGEIPQPISPFGASIGSGSTYQWQMSTDNITFNNIPVTTRQLTFSAGDAWVPTQTSYYRLVFTSGTIASCIATSTAATVTVARVPTIPQVAGPASSQIICAGSAITTVSFAISNTATVTAEGLNNTGLVLSGPDANGQYHLTGIPRVSTTVVLTAVGASTCNNARVEYTIHRVQGITQPATILKNGTAFSNAVFQANSQWFNNTVCQDLVNPNTMNLQLCNALGQIITSTIIFSLSGIFNPLTRVR